MSDNFEENVIKQLDNISSRLAAIETKIDEATSFADSVLGDDGVMPSDGLEALKSTFSSLLNPEAFGAEAFGGNSSDMQGSPESMQDLVSSLKIFQDRLSSVRDAVADLPKDGQPLNEDEE
jgi:hypothetical protein